MPVIPIDDFSDPRLAHYRNLKDHELAAAGDLFIAEGLFVTQRLLRSKYPCQSVLCTPRKLDSVLPDLKPDVPLYLVPEALMHDIVGYKFHTGALAIGQRLPAPPLASLVPAAGPATFVVLPQTNNLENLGAIARLCAGFGVDALIVGEQCGDPFYRRSLRVSMGTLLFLPVFCSTDLKHDLATLRDDHQFELSATVLDPAAEPLAGARRTNPRMALLFGCEGEGLSRDYISLCPRRLTIPMPAHIDSLNVSTSAAIFLYHFTQFAAQAVRST
ncbi:MAG TPA: RNA methyltransferase [Tepidisphaeraceae bacterium]|jgi:tRNA G18 (ribose-2'-O)-methylase SpoU|nr:RNA methyltransferase [Tepidisphaeraceae bacterium]